MTEAPFAVQAALRRHFERERDSALGVTLRMLTRSDASRLQFVDGTLIVDDRRIERKYVETEDERVTIEAAQLDASLTPVFGYAVTSGSRPQEAAWLLTSDGHLIDPARRNRDAEGFLGVALRRTEVANWLPDHRSAVAEQDVHRLAV